MHPHGGALQTTTRAVRGRFSIDLVREMSSTADGFGANVSLLKESATRLLDEFGQSASVSEHFDALSPSTHNKVFRELWLHPSISFFDLLDVVELTLTLAEAHVPAQGPEREAMIQGLLAAQVERGLPGSLAARAFLRLQGASVPERARRTGFERPREPS